MENGQNIKELEPLVPNTLLTLRACDLPKVIVLELENGSRKKYVLQYAKNAGGIILNKAI
jgi:hypothetical protein